MSRPEAPGCAPSWSAARDSVRRFGQLEVLLSTPNPFGPGLTRLDPFYDPLRDHPRFQALLEMYE